MDSPPRFSEQSPQMTTPRFTEHLSSTPPYQHWMHPAYQDVPEYADTISNPESMSHRLSSKERPLDPEIQSPGLQSVWAGEGEKEVVEPPPKPEPIPQGFQLYQRAEPEDPKGPRICGMGAKWFWILIGVLLCLAIGLGVGLGVGLGEKKSSSPSASASSSTTSGSAPSSTPTLNIEYLIGGAINPEYYSQSGAFNGSGIALASQSFATNLESGTQGALVMYFQHHDGSIRWEQLSSSGSWLGGSVSEVVAVDAKNNTPLSAVSYSINGSNTWHVFYIDEENQIKQRTNSNTSNVWVDGPINKANLIANDADQVGMQACWYGNDYGDSDYDHTPLPTSDGSAAYTNEIGMHIWYASDDTTFQQLGWRAGDAEWEFQQSWLHKNGHAGVGCYSWASGSTTTYVMLVNQQNTVEFWWKDTNTNLTNSTTHPINEWVNSSIAINEVNPSTSLGYTNYFYCQMCDNNIYGYNISWAAENTTFLQPAPGSGAAMPNSIFQVDGEAGITGTHLSVSALPNTGGGNNLVVFYQTNGTDITEYTRDWIAGQWTSVDIDIPQQ